MAICRLIAAADSISLIGGRICGHETETHIYFQFLADSIVGVPLLQDSKINMHITLMYMHCTPRWREVLQGMQDQWRSFEKSSVEHTNSSWRLSEYSDEARAMVELKVGSRLYSALLQCVGTGVQKLPVPDQPGAWRMRREFHLSVLPNR